MFISRVGLGFATFGLNPSMIGGCSPILSEMFIKRGLQLSVLELHSPTFLDPIHVVEKVDMRGRDPSSFKMCMSASV